MDRRAASGDGGRVADAVAFPRLTRRGLLQVGAWAAPALVVASAVPAAVASPDSIASQFVAAETDWVTLASGGRGTSFSMIPADLIGVAGRFQATLPATTPTQAIGGLVLTYAIMHPSGVMTDQITGLDAQSIAFSGAGWELYGGPYFDFPYSYVYQFVFPSMSTGQTTTELTFSINTDTTDGPVLEYRWAAYLGSTEPDVSIDAADVSGQLT